MDNNQDSAECSLVVVETGEGVSSIHSYTDDDYDLFDIHRLFSLGTVSDGRLILSRTELRELKVMCDAYSFDYPDALVEMCGNIVDAAALLEGETMVLWEA